MHRVLIIESGCKALQLHQIYQDLGFETVSVYTNNNSQEKYVQKSNFSINIKEYMTDNHSFNFFDYIKIALESDAHFIHPGFNYFARLPLFPKICEEHGLVFLGNTSDTLSKLKKNSVFNPIEKNKKADKNEFKKIETLGYKSKKSLQFIYQSNFYEDVYYIGSTEYYERASCSNEICVSSPCSSVQSDDFSRLNEFCKTFIKKMGLIGIVTFDFTYNEMSFYLKEIKLGPHHLTYALEARLGIGLIEMEALLFLNGTIEKTEKSYPKALCKHIYPPNRKALIKSIYFPVGPNTCYNVDRNPSLLHSFKRPIASICSYGYGDITTQFKTACDTFKIDYEV